MTLLPILTSKAETQVVVSDTNLSSYRFYLIIIHLTEYTYFSLLGFLKIRSKFELIFRATDVGPEHEGSFAAEIHFELSLQT